MARYKAFISYSRSEAAGVSPRLKKGVERYGSPWYLIRSFRIFLDTQTLAPGDDLWGSLDRELEDSEWLIFVASRPAASSDGVNHEIEWWLEEKPQGRLLLVDTEDLLVWDKAKKNFRDPTVVPPALLNAFKKQPNPIKVPAASPQGSELNDDQIKSAIIDAASALREESRGDLVEKEEREQKVRNRFVRGTVSILLILLAASVVATLLAVHQGNIASARAKVALSRQIAAASEAATGANLDASMLLAVQAFRVNPNPQTRAALFNADTASPHLVRFLHADAKVTALVGSRTGGAVIAGLADGSVLRWTDSGDGPQRLMKLSRGVVSLATDRDGSVVAASDRATGMTWRRGGHLLALPVPAGSHCDAVGLSPSGKTVVYGATLPGFENGTITVAPVDRPKRGIPHPAPFPAGEIVVPSDRRALLLGPPSMAWENFSHWTKHSTDEPGFGAHTFAFAASPDGRLVSDTNGSNPVPIWHTRSKFSSVTDEAEDYAEAPLTQQIALAISPDGDRMAVVGPGQIYVTPIVKAGEVRDRVQALQENPVAQPLSLTGESPERVTFTDNSHLLSAAGKEIGIWDTEQIDRLSRTETVPLEFGCDECGPPALSISRDGKRLAVVNGSGSFAMVQSFDGGEREVLPPSELEFGYGFPVWHGEGGIVAFPVWESAGGSHPSFPGPAQLPSSVRLWPAGRGEHRELSDASIRHGRAAVTVDSEGDVFIQDTLTGVQLAASPARRGALGPEEFSSAAVNPAGTLLALAVENHVRVERVPSWREVAHFDVPGFPSLSFAGGHLLVQRSDGAMEVRNETGTGIQRTIPGTDDSGSYAPSPTGNFVARSLTDGSIALEELATGDRVASFATPGGSFFLKTGLAFTPDGRTLVSLTESSGEDETGELVRRDVSDAALIEVACRDAGHDLDDAEWRALVGTEAPADLRCNSG